MKRRIIALILVMGLLAGMGLDGKMTLAAESTPAGQTKEIAKIEVVDTEIELPYKSTFTKENVVIKVTYEDATEQLVHPEKMTAVDTTKIGEQQLELSYQDKTINYTVRIVPRQVTGLRRKETTKKKAVIEWNALAESKEYEIFTSSKETSGFSLLKSTTKTSYEFTNLKEGQILYVKIRAGVSGYYGKESEVLLVALQPGEVTKITATKKDSEGNDVSKKYKLSRYAKVVEQEALNNITRENQKTYISVKGEVEDDYNATILSRQLQDKLDNYKTPSGYTIEIQGESQQVMDMVSQLLLAILLGFVLVYLVMVAQFQSLLSPFIIIFTVPLAFTGGMLGLMLFGQKISAMSLMGFMILMGTVVNNGIVFVDYANKLRIQGVDKKTALIVTGKTRMRPILMTAMTTILSMSVMVFSQDAGSAMQKGMAIVVSFGLLYATFMTLFIVPVLYDIFYRKKPKVIDVGDDNIDDVPDEGADIIRQLQENK